MLTIDTESRLRIKNPFEIDNMGKRYKTDNDLYTFTSPSLWTIEKHYFFLLKNSIEKTFEIKYRYRPSYLSFAEYGVVNLDYLLMRMNGIFCAEDFDLNTVIIPSMSSIVTICQDKFSKVDASNLESVNL